MFLIIGFARGNVDSSYSLQNLRIPPIIEKNNRFESFRQSTRSTMYELVIIEISHIVVRLCGLWGLWGLFYAAIATSFNGYKPISS